MAARRASAGLAIALASCVPNAPVIALPSLTASPPPTLSPSPSPSASALVLPEAVAWSRVRAIVPAAAPVITPTWLPSTISRATVAIEALDPRTPAYRVRYSGPLGSLVFEMGPSTIAGFGSLGVRVRGTSAVVSMAADPTTPAPKSVSWKERGYGYVIGASAGMGGDELMQTAWSVTSTTPAPRGPYPYARTKVGACSKPTMTAEDLVRRALELTTSGDADAVNDCFALELVEQSPAGFAGWATMGPLRDVSIRPLGTEGGRSDVGATWTFTRDVGGAWPPAGQPAFQVFTVGLEDGTPRVYELGTARAALPK